MRIPVLAACVLMTGCAGTPNRCPNGCGIGEPPKTTALAPHAQALKFQQSEERRLCFEKGAKIEGATVVR